MSYEIHSSCEIYGIPAESDEGCILKHSTAHLLAQAVMELYPDAKPTIGPAMTGVLLRLCNGANRRI